MVALGLLFVFWKNIGPEIDKALGTAPELQVATEADASQAALGQDSTPVTEIDINGKVVTKEVAKDVDAVIAAAPAQIIQKLDDSILVGEGYDVVVSPQSGSVKVRLTGKVEGTDDILYSETQEEGATGVIIGDNELESLTLAGEAADWEYGQAIITESSADNIVITRKVLGKSLLVKQSISLTKDFQFKQILTLVNTGDSVLKFSDLAINCGQITPAAETVSMTQGNDQGVDAYDRVEEKVTPETFQSIEKGSKEQIEENRADSIAGAKYELEKPESSYLWVAVKNRYFAWIIEKDEKTAGFTDVYAAYVPRKVEGKEDPVNILTAVASLQSFEIAAGASHEISLNCYAGPQELDLLNSMTHDKKDIMQLNLFMFFKVGWIGFISELMLKALLYFYSLIGSWGVSIICLTLVIKTLFWRITNKSTESMKKMSSLSPQIKEINEQYKDNPQVKQQKVMELYREVGVNPLAGCLPLLLQMPVFIALFNSLRGAIELRHSSFLWAADLSRPDAIELFGLSVHPLAIAWAQLMLLQQKVVPSSGDPTQKKVMMFMPVFMLFVCYDMPSGLTLYWTFSTIMSILQYYINNKKASKLQENAPAVAATR